ncbi:MAG: cation:proton antiporter [bacterium]
MITRITSLLFVLASMSIVVHFSLPALAGPVPSTLTLGFLLLSAYGFGFLLELIGLPRITGYILAGLFFGPSFLAFFDQASVGSLSFINSLALAFIAFCAGGELRLSEIQKQLKSIVYLIVGSSLVVFLGVTFFVFLVSTKIAFMADYPLFVRLAISSLFGIIAVARSPSSTIAIISETKAKGPYTSLVLSVTVAKDVVIIAAFAVLVSVCQLVIKTTGNFNIVFVLLLLLEIIMAFILGFFLGKGIVFLIEKVGVEFPIIIVGMGFFVIKFSHYFGHYLQSAHDISINLEPLLICMAAGYTVQNYSKHGKTFLARLDRVSLPIYIAFFAIAGASIDIEVLKTGWMLGLLVVFVRTGTLYIGCYYSGKWAGDKKLIYKNSWMGFITQAGVSLGLLTEIVRRFPEIGVPIQSILIAAITVNQIIGPILFKIALNKVGETNIKKPKDLEKGCTTMV